MALCRVENYFIASFCGDQLFENNVKASDALSKLQTVTLFLEMERHNISLFLSLRDILEKLVPQN